MFEVAYPIVLKYEGGYVDNPVDPGGPTNKGITQKTYNLYRKLWQLPPQHVRYISDSEVETIYKSYWTLSRANEFCRNNPLTAVVHFDFSINAGNKQAAKTLQRTVGVKLIDGIIGNITLSAINLSDDYLLASDYLEKRVEFYKNLIIKKPKLKEFLKGWLWRVKHLKGIIDERAKGNQRSNSKSSTT